MLSLLPPDSPHLLPILDLLHDPDHLWSPYGIRSLSASHPEFGRGENYWKGPIWMPMNYMILSSLYKVRFPMCWAGNCTGIEGGMNRLMQLWRVLTRSMPRRFIRNYGKMSWRTCSRYIIIAVLFVIPADSTPRNTSGLDMPGSNMTQIRERAEEGMIPEILFVDEG